MYWESVNLERSFREKDLEREFLSFLETLGRIRNLLLVPPDLSRLKSRAGFLSRLAWKYFGPAVKGVIPALGTHRTMTSAEIREMFGDLPGELFLEHNWRRDLSLLGTLPAELIDTLSEGRFSRPIPVKVNRELTSKNVDCILSLGQVVPHEVAGMANYNKNIFVGLGGPEIIHGSHYLGAVYGIERILGKAENPVRSLFNFAGENFGNSLPVIYVHTVIGEDREGNTGVLGLFCGDDIACYKRAAELSQRVNIFHLKEKPNRIVTYLDPRRYKTTWIANKSIYRTRRAIKEGGKLLVIAPGVESFGEDEDIDRLIRKYGYCGRERIMALVEREKELSGNLCAAAHLIHGSSEDKFSITYCTENLTGQELSSVGFGYSPVKEIERVYPFRELKQGWHRTREGEDFLFIEDPGLGLWIAGED